MDRWNPTIIRPSLFLPFFILLFFSSKIHLTGAADSISTGLTLSGNQTIISRDGNFELGFFSPGQSKNYYIGIWFKKVSVKTVVWVANRETPLPDTSSELKISEENGNLVLVDQTKTPTWSSNSTSITSNSTIAVLLDSGNLVLRDGSNSSLVFWQSFDHPTDTWLPDNKIGLNKITGLRQRLVSWTNSEDPSPGAFSFQIEENGMSQYFMLWNNSRRYWSTGLWDGYRFSSLSELPSEFWDHKIDLIDFRYIAGEKENYFSYSSHGHFIRMVLGISGQLSASIWASETENWNMFLSFPSDQCNVYALCGPFGVCNANGSYCTCLQGFEPRYKRNWEMGDWSGGCDRENDIVCADDNSINGEKVVFQEISGVQLPATPKSLIAERVGNCKVDCLDDCSCTAYSYSDSGCFLWYGDLLNLRRPAGEDVVEDFCLRLSAPTSKARKEAARRVVIPVSTFFSFWVIVLMLVYWRRRRKLQVHTQGASSDSLVVFRYRELKRATKHFTEKLGGGSFGSVFKGTLPDSSIIAVKKLEGLRQGEKEFRSEVSTIGKIQHVNLVRLRGFCPEGTNRLLVYDYMPNGSLSSHLFGQFSNALSWKTRYQIALGIARGLAYLHEECRECILHCDIKPENILLDSSFCPKVADFGMAKLLGRESSRVLTTMRGTIGYLAPEWVLGMAITAKADVYSYGMLVFEMISGRRNYRQGNSSDGGYFPLEAASKAKEGDVLCLLDRRLEGEADVEELNRVCRVACWCIQEDEATRPSMGQVVRILEGVLEVGVAPIPGFLQHLLDQGL